jgi:catechol-2,3-dioxygenase
VANESVEVIRLGHVAFRTNALPELLAHYTEVIGLRECRRDDDGTVHLTCGGAGADLELRPSDDAGLDHVAFDLVPDVDVEQTVSRLAAHGVVAHAWGRRDPGVADSIGIRDPEGNLLQLSVPDGALEAAPVGGGIAPRKLGHVATRVADAPTVQSFYERVLGFRWSDTNGTGVVFLRCNADHHSVNLFQIPNPGQVHHLAFELEDEFSSIQRAGDILARHDIPIIWGPGRHGAGHNIFTYHLDPAGHIVELFNQLDRMSDERQGYFDPRPWHDHRPQRPRVWGTEDKRGVGLMSPPRPAAFLD